MKNRSAKKPFALLLLSNALAVALGFSTLSLQQSWASPIVSQKDLTRIEAEFKRALEQQRPDVDHLYYLYLLAARELRAHGFEVKAREYYQKALTVHTSQDKSEAAIEVFFACMLFAQQQMYSADDLVIHEGTMITHRLVLRTFR